MVGENAVRGETFSPGILERLPGSLEVVLHVALPAVEGRISCRVACVFTSYSRTPPGTDFGQDVTEPPLRAFPEAASLQAFADARQDTPRHPHHAGCPILTHGTNEGAPEAFMSVVHLHLLLNHVPVVGVLLVALILTVALVRNSDAIGKLGLATLAGMALVTVAVYFTGEPAEEAIEGLAGVSEVSIHAHEEVAVAAFSVTALGGVVAVAVLWWYRRRPLARAAMAASLLIVLLASGLMARTANLGGQIRHTEIRAGAVGGDRDTRVRDDH